MESSGQTEFGTVPIDSIKKWWPDEDQTKNQPTNNSTMPAAENHNSPTPPMEAAFSSGNIPAALGRTAGLDTSLSASTTFEVSLKPREDYVLLRESPSFIRPLPRSPEEGDLHAQPTALERQLEWEGRLRQEVRADHEFYHHQGRNVNTSQFYQDISAARSSGSGTPGVAGEGRRAQESPIVPTDPMVQQTPREIVFSHLAQEKQRMTSNGRTPPLEELKDGLQAMMDSWTANSVTPDRTRLRSSTSPTQFVSGSLQRGRHSEAFTTPGEGEDSDRMMMDSAQMEMEADHYNPIVCALKKVSPSPSPIRQRANNLSPSSTRSPRRSSYQYEEYQPTHEGHDSGIDENAKWDYASPRVRFTLEPHWTERLFERLDTVEATAPGRSPSRVKFQDQQLTHQTNVNRVRQRRSSRSHTRHEDVDPKTRSNLHVLLHPDLMATRWNPPQREQLLATIRSVGQPHTEEDARSSPYRSPKSPRSRGGSSPRRASPVRNQENTTVNVSSNDFHGRGNISLQEIEVTQDEEWQRMQQLQEDQLLHIVCPLCHDEVYFEAWLGHSHRCVEERLQLEWTLTSFLPHTPTFESTGAINSYSSAQYKRNTEKREGERSSSILGTTSVPALMKKREEVELDEEKAKVEQINRVLGRSQISDKDFSAWTSPRRPPLESLAPVLLDASLIERNATSSENVQPPVGGEDAVKYYFDRMTFLSHDVETLVRWKCLGKGTPTTPSSPSPVALPSDQVRALFYQLQRELIAAWWIAVEGDTLQVDQDTGHLSPDRNRLSAGLSPEAAAERSVRRKRDLAARRDAEEWLSILRDGHPSETNFSAATLPRPRLLNNSDNSTLDFVHRKLTSEQLPESKYKQKWHTFLLERFHPQMAQLRQRLWIACPRGGNCTEIHNRLTHLSWEMHAARCWYVTFHRVRPGNEGRYGTKELIGQGPVKLGDVALNSKSTLKEVTVEDCLLHVNPHLRPWIMLSSHTHQSSNAPRNQPLNRDQSKREKKIDGEKDGFSHAGRGHLVVTRADDDVVVPLAATIDQSGWCLDYSVYFT